MRLISASPIRQFRSNLTLLACACFLLVSTPLAQAGDDDNAKRLKQLKATIQALRNELEAARNDRDDINKTLENAEKDIGELSKRANKIKKELDKRQHNLNDLRDERGQLEKNKTQQQSLVGDYINSAYRLGQQGNLRLLLNQEDPSRVSRNLRYYDYFVEARSEKIRAFLSTIERINQIEPEIAYQTEKVRQDFGALQSQKEKLKGAQNTRRQLLSKIEKQINNQDQKLRSKMEDRRQLQRLLSKVIENIADIKPENNNASFSSLKGSLPWPASGRVVRRFGSNRITNKMKWEGLLIKSNAGEPVRSVHYGRVVFSDYLRGHGLLIIVDHGAGYMSLYAHNQALYKELGEWVEQGDTIASVGNSGGRQDSALYFELRYQGRPTNPQSWLSRA
ncbi:MAG: peptidoglycan DD-metalloendopeptidase family protein [Agarilytica sp.]